MKKLWKIVLYTSHTNVPCVKFVRYVDHKNAPHVNMYAIHSNLRLERINRMVAKLQPYVTTLYGLELHLYPNWL